ncbi:MAG: DnaA regulatory inactivator Hda [Burkholderiaceae bacterium]|nr:DnaA regulatory inactivator Hda [Burkholderiaceae bacterium]
MTATMQQMALDLLEPAPPTLANFVAGTNGECVARIGALAMGERSQRFVYLWGSPGSGRSHLLAALGGGAAALDAKAPIAQFGYDPQRLLYAVDDVQLLDDTRQQALFHLFNRVQAGARAALVCTGDRPPLGLELREDLRTRLGAGLVFEVHLLSDDDKAKALRTAASERGVSVADDVVPWLLTHHSRDIRALLGVLDALDRRALELKRPITLALARELLAAGREPKQRSAAQPEPGERPPRTRPD